MRDGEEGFLVEAGRTDAMSVRIVELLQDPDLRERLGRAAAKRVRREFTADRMTDGWLRLLNHVAAGRPEMRRG
jgi:glycosyltransferase involved in cell wall biosynthesis